MTPRATRGLSIGDVSARTGLSVSAIRFYEGRGLIAPDRNAGGQRRFVRSDIRRLSYILIAQKCGFTIGQIRETLARLPEGRTPTKADWTRLGRDFRRELDARIDLLTALREKLDGCIGCGCLSLQKCKLYNPDDQAARHGQGPRYLLGDGPETPTG